ncbi:MAG: hypothetical protein IPF54_13380 [Draconibacterium sp.]|nr:hypothetical protein [Draconibacterium sp.]
MKNLILIFAIVFNSAIYTATAQVDVTGKVETQTNNRVNNNVDEGIDKGLDAVENSVKNLFKKKDKNAKPPETMDSQESDQNTQSNETETKSQTVQANQQSLQSYSKFDFIPGEKVIFYEDFSQDAVGDFPALWNTNGSGEVVNTNLYPGNWLKYVMDESIWTDQLLTLPDNYTLEFDVVPIEGSEGGMGGWGFRLMKCYK